MFAEELEAGKGYLGDANVSAWSNTVERVKKEYPDVKIVIPGHGEYGDGKVLDYTIQLLKGNNQFCFAKSMVNGCEIYL
jgi:metallo-beta-lactamase class B